MLLIPIEAECRVSELFSHSSHLRVDLDRDEQAETWDKLVYLEYYGILALTFPQRIQ